MDGLQSFSYLVDNLPQWMERLDKLSQQVAERHAEFTALARSTEFTPSLRKEKTGSMESLKPRDEVSNVPEPPSTPPAASNINSTSTPPQRIDINPESKRLFQDHRLQAKRKRNSGSIISNMSGAQRLRSRMSLIVYYDSAIQDNFEWLVRSIASARNTLRKGKTSASFKARLASMGMEESPFGDRAGFSMRNPNVPRLPKTGGNYQVGGSSTEGFEKADKELEAAQSLCEIGAHQFLREGLCNDELSGTKERLNACLRIASEQKVVYEALEENNRKREDEPQADEVDDLKVDTALSVDPVVAIDTPSSSGGDTQVETVAVAVGKSDDIMVDSVAVSGGFGLESNIIEVDDADDSASFHVDLSAFRKTRRGR